MCGSVVGWVSCWGEGCYVIDSVVGESKRLIDDLLVIYFSISCVSQSPLVLYFYCLVKGFYFN